MRNLQEEKITAAYNRLTENGDKCTARTFQRAIVYSVALIALGGVPDYLHHDTQLENHLFDLLALHEFFGDIAELEAQQE